MHRHHYEVAERQALREVEGVGNRAAAVIPTDNHLNRQLSNLGGVFQQLAIIDKEVVRCVVRKHPTVRDCRWVRLCHS